MVDADRLIEPVQGWEALLQLPRDRFGQSADRLDDTVLVGPLALVDPDRAWAQVGRGVVDVSSISVGCSQIPVIVAPTLLVGSSN